MDATLAFRFWTHCSHDVRIKSGFSVSAEWIINTSDMKYTVFWTHWRKDRKHDDSQVWLRSDCGEAAENCTQLSLEAKRPFIIHDSEHASYFPAWQFSKILQMLPNLCSFLNWFQEWGWDCAICPTKWTIPVFSRSMQLVQIVFYKRLSQFYVLISGEKSKLITWKTIRFPQYVCFSSFPKEVWTGVVMLSASKGYSFRQR